MLQAEKPGTDDVVERIHLPPDPGMVDSLGAHHTLESAIADLVDNSIDAGARRVSVRLLTERQRLVQVEVLDDGHGMDEHGINAAMTLGRRRRYRKNDLGHFGMGLKAASFGHADTLTVCSTNSGSGSVGRRINRKDFSADFACEILAPRVASDAEKQRATLLGSDIGTTVVWTGIRNAYRGRSEAEASKWITTAEQHLRTHLGLIFHRKLAGARLAVDVLVDDRGQAAGGVGVPIDPIDPFGYTSPGDPRYPKTLIATAGRSKVKLVCHIWPARTDITGFRIGGCPGEQFQGFYIYRKDRLLQAGGWSHTANPTPARQLARVILDDSSAIGSLVTMNPEKQGLKFEPIFHEAVSHAIAADGTTFDQYLQDAEVVLAEARTRRRRRKPAITPDKGFPPKLRRTIKNELPMIDGDALRVQWKRLPRGEFFDIDLPEKTLWLNQRYRPLFAPAGGSLNDAPVMKALLYLLTHHVFEGHFLGARDRDEIALWKSVLGAAAEAEATMKGEA